MNSFDGKSLKVSTCFWKYFENFLIFVSLQMFYADLKEVLLSFIEASCLFKKLV